MRKPQKLIKKRILCRWRRFSQLPVLKDFTVFGVLPGQLMKAGTADESRDKIADVIAKFDFYCEPRKNIPFERYCFNRRQQQSGESIDQYITALRRLAANCEFDSITPDELLREAARRSIEYSHVSGTFEEFLYSYWKWWDTKELRHVIQNGWPDQKSKVISCITPFWDYRHELFTHRGLVMKGDRIIVPVSLRK